MLKKYRNAVFLPFTTRCYVVYAGWKKKAETFSLVPYSLNRGNVSRARALIEGRFVVSGQLFDFSNGLGMFWQNTRLSVSLQREIHAFGWLDDLATLGSGKARELAQTLVWSWIYLYRTGAGVGWEPFLVGQRVITCIHHAEFLLHKQDKAVQDLFFASLCQQVLYLRRHWKKTPSLRGRIAGLVGVIYGGIFLSDMNYVLKGALKKLKQECRQNISKNGEINHCSCNDILEIFTLISWAKTALERCKIDIPAEIIDAVSAMAETLRILRQADASLPCFDNNLDVRDDGWLDKILACNTDNWRRARASAMGIYSFKSGRVSLAVDTAKPRSSAYYAGYTGSASVFAFQLNTSNQPIIISTPLSPVKQMNDPEVAATTLAHSSLYMNMIDGADFVKQKNARKPMFVSQYLNHEYVKGNGVKSFIGHHTMFTPRYGINHSRQIELSFDGGKVVGRDIIGAFMYKKDDSDIDIEQYFSMNPNVEVDFSVCFNVHPNMKVFYDDNVSAICLMSRTDKNTGEKWFFRANGYSDIALKEGIFFDSELLENYGHKKIVLTASLKGSSHMSVLSWGFTRQASH